MASTKNGQSFLAGVAYIAKRAKWHKDAFASAILDHLCLGASFIILLWQKKCMLVTLISTSEVESIVLQHHVAYDHIRSAGFNRMS